MFVIGDIHGCLVELDELLGRIRARREADETLVLLGDYIDRGPDSPGVLRRILELRDQLGERLVLLVGNHEQWLLELLRNPRKTSWLLGMDGLATLAQFDPALAETVQRELREAGPRLLLAGPEEPPPDSLRRIREAIPSELVGLLEEGLQLSHSEAGALCVHAGVDVDRPLDEQTIDAVCWSPTAELYRSWRGPPRLIVGHEPTALIDPAAGDEPLIGPGVIALDTGVERTGRLSALRWPQLEILQSGPARLS